VPEDLDNLDATERRQVYNMLRIEAIIAPDGPLEVSGDILAVCEMASLST
jgi:hypothetical protein